MYHVRACAISNDCKTVLASWSKMVYIYWFEPSSVVALPGVTSMHAYQLGLLTFSFSSKEAE